MRIFTPQHGFTLTEMAVTVAVLAILAALAVPSFQSTLNKRRVTGAAEQFYADLQYARAEAIKGDQNIFISFQPATGVTSGTWCYGISAGAPCTCNPNNCQINNVDKVVNQQGFTGVTLTHNFTGNNINFRPRRGDVRSNSDASLGNGTVNFTINDNGANRTINIAIGNLVRTRLCSPSSAPVSGYPTC